MSEYDQKTLLIIAESLVVEGGYLGNPLMEKPEIKNLVNEILTAQGKVVAEPPLVRNTS